MSFHVVWMIMLGGSLCCMDDFLGMGDSYGDDESHYIPDLMPQGGP